MVFCWHVNVLAFLGLEGMPSWNRAESKTVWHPGFLTHRWVRTRNDRVIQLKCIRSEEETLLHWSHPWVWPCGGPDQETLNFQSMRLMSSKLIQKCKEGMTPKLRKFCSRKIQNLSGHIKKKQNNVAVLHFDFWKVIRFMTLQHVLLSHTNTQKTCADLFKLARAWKCICQLFTLTFLSCALSCEASCFTPPVTTPRPAVWLGNFLLRHRIYLHLP